MVLTVKEYFPHWGKSMCVLAEDMEKYKASIVFVFKFKYINERTVTSMLACDTEV